jgi:predicted DNA-binding transcriptional regulator AlpA
MSDTNTPQPAAKKPGPVSVAEAADHTGLSVSTLNKLRVFGGGPVFLKLGRRVAYDVTDLNAWLASKRRRSTSDAGLR